MTITKTYKSILKTKSSIKNIEFYWEMLNVFDNLELTMFNVFGDVYAIFEDNNTDFKYDVNRLSELDTVFFVKLLDDNRLEDLNDLDIDKILNIANFNKFEYILI